MRRSPTKSKFKGLTPWNSLRNDVWKDRKTYTKEEKKQRAKERYNRIKERSHILI